MPQPDLRDFDERYSACFVDFGVKTAAGLLIGSMMGSFFLRGVKKWPMFIGGGLGVGMAYTNCENSLNNFLLAMDPKACVINFFKGQIQMVISEDVTTYPSFLHTQREIFLYHLAFIFFVPIKETTLTSTLLL